MQSILEQAHSQVLEARSVEYLLKTRAFENAWEMATQEEKDLLSVKSQEEVRSWINIVRSKHIDYLNSREIKAIARSLFIPNYSRLPIELLKELILRIWANEHRKNKETARNSPTVIGLIQFCIEAPKRVSQNRTSD